MRRGASLLTVPNSSAAAGLGSEGHRGEGPVLAQLSSVGRHQAFEFLKPVEDDVDLGWPLSILTRLSTDVPHASIASGYRRPNAVIAQGMSEVLAEASPSGTAEFPLVHTDADGTHFRITLPPKANSAKRLYFPLT